MRASPLRQGLRALRQSPGVLVSKLDQRFAVGRVLGDQPGVQLDQRSSVLVAQRPGRLGVRRGLRLELGGALGQRREVLFFQRLQGLRVGRGLGFEPRVPFRDDPRVLFTERLLRLRVGARRGLELHVVLVERSGVLVVQSTRRLGMSVVVGVQLSAALGLGSDVLVAKPLYVLCVLVVGRLQRLGVGLGLGAGQRRAFPKRLLVIRGLGFQLGVEGSEGFTMLVEEALKRLRVLGRERLQGLLSLNGPRLGLRIALGHRLGVFSLQLLLGRAVGGLLKFGLSVSQGDDVRLFSSERLHGRGVGLERLDLLCVACLEGGVPFGDRRLVFGQVNRELVAKRLLRCSGSRADAGEGLGRVGRCRFALSDAAGHLGDAATRFGSGLLAAGELARQRLDLNLESAVGRERFTPGLALRDQGLACVTQMLGLTACSDEGVLQLANPNLGVATEGLVVALSGVQALLERLVLRGQPLEVLELVLQLSPEGAVFSEKIDGSGSRVHECIQMYDEDFVKKAGSTPVATLGLRGRIRRAVEHLFGEESGEVADDVADRGDVRWASVVIHHRDVTIPTVVHQVEDQPDLLVGAEALGVPGHVVGDRKTRPILGGVDDASHQIPFGEDPAQPPVPRDGDRAGVMGLEQIDGLAHGRRLVEGHHRSELQRLQRLVERISGQLPREGLGLQHALEVFFVLIHRSDSQSPPAHDGPPSFRCPSSGVRCRGRQLGARAARSLLVTWIR